jgi:hypothetical protein
VAHVNICEAADTMADLYYLAWYQLNRLLRFSATQSKMPLMMHTQSSMALIYMS